MAVLVEACYLALCHLLSELCPASQFSVTCSNGPGTFSSGWYVYVAAMAVNYYMSPCRGV
jgi:hypothetical protein